MNKQVCILLLLLTLVSGFLHGVLHPLFVYNLPYCDPNVIDHFICDLFPLPKLSCTDTHIFGLFVAANSGLMCMLIFSIVITSYVLILCSLRTHSNTAEQQKAVST